MTVEEQKAADQAQGAEVQEIDYAKLAQPAGFTDTEGKGPTTQEVASTPAAKPAAQAPTDGGEGKTRKEEGADAAAKVVDTPDFRTKLQAQLTAKFGAEVKVPDTVTEENYLDFVRDVSLGTLHPEAVRLQRAIEQGVKSEDYFKGYGAIDSQLALSDKDLLRMALKETYGQTAERQDGLTDEVIDSRISALEQSGELAFKAFEMRNELKAEKAKRAKEVESYSSPAKREPAPDFDDPKVLQAFKAELNTSIEPILKEGKLYGLDLGNPEDRTKLTERVGALLRPDKKTGLSAFEASLQTNEGMIRAAILFDMAQKGVIGAQIAQRGEQVKNKYLNELGLTPPASPAGNVVKGDEIDFAKLSAPAGFIDKP